MLVIHKLVKLVTTVAGAKRFARYVPKVHSAKIHPEILPHSVLKVSGQIPAQSLAILVPLVLLVRIHQQLIFYRSRQLLLSVQRQQVK
jgi:hypothetical protein